ncbi:hypothetical protein SNEBB_005150 [Seison nebaliae]|nr:hypothetical protein SNEBB_005150 [Seison nebaliae]
MGSLLSAETIHSKLIDAIDADEYAEVEKLINSIPTAHEKKSLLNLSIADDTFHRKALHYAAWKGNISIIRFLLINGANVDVTDDTGMRPVMCATSSGNMEPVRALMEYNCDLLSPDINGWSLLHEAASRGLSELVNILLQRNININTTTSEGRTALHLAVDYDKQDIIEILLNYKKEDDITGSISNVSFSPLNVDAQDKWGWTALHMASGHDRVKLVELLIKDGNANHKLCDNRGNTAYEWSIHLLAKRVKNFYETNGLAIASDKPKPFPGIECDDYEINIVSGRFKVVNKQPNRRSIFEVTNNLEKLLNNTASDDSVPIMPMTSLANPNNDQVFD